MAIDFNTITTGALIRKARYEISDGEFAGLIADAAEYLLDGDEEAAREVLIAAIVLQYFYDNDLSWVNHPERIWVENIDLDKGIAEVAYRDVLHREDLAKIFADIDDFEGEEE